MPDQEIRVARCGPREVPSAAEVESLYHAATCGSPLRETRATAAGSARLYAALLRRPDLEAVAARAGRRPARRVRLRARLAVGRAGRRLGGPAPGAPGRGGRPARRPVRRVPARRPPVVPPGRPGPAAAPDPPFRNEDRRVADHPGRADPGDGPVPAGRVGTDRPRPGHPRCPSRPGPHSPVSAARASAARPYIWPWDASRAASFPRRRGADMPGRPAWKTNSWCPTRR